MACSFLSRLIKIRNRTLHFLRNKLKAKLKTDKRPEIPCFRGRDIAITSYQTLVMLHIIDSCQTLGFLKCLVFFIFCLAISWKNCIRMLKLPNENYVNLYSTWCFHTYCRSFWPPPVMQNLNLLRPNLAHLHSKISSLSPVWR